ncbi:MAG: exo-alpha-sialidase [candidate division Zixibacteria bacterium]|nr:exo-alpha-sialidase [candidate division Zixibacteria bacterium]
MCTGKESIDRYSRLVSLYVIIVLSMLTITIIQAQDENVNYTDQPSDTWKLHYPIILDSENKGSYNRMLSSYPIGVFWQGDSPVVAMLWHPKESPELILWKEIGHRKWIKYSTIRSVGYPKVFAIDTHTIGVVTQIGKKSHGGYGKAIHFLRIRDGIARDTIMLAPSPDAGQRITVSAVESSGESIFVFLLHEFSGGKLNQLLFASSHDGGETWTETKCVGNTNMGEDFSYMQGFCFDSLHVVRFLCEPVNNYLHTTLDGGISWSKSLFTPNDDLMNTRRLPLGRTLLADSVGIVYALQNPTNRKEVRYYFTQSKDKATTWSKGVPIIPYIKASDPALSIRVAKSGNHFAFSYMETIGSWSKGEIVNHIVISKDNGETWADEPISDFYTGDVLFSGVGGAPDGSRILLNSVIRVIENDKERFYYTVQEYSPRNLDTFDESEIKSPIKKQ